jgi:hypothetical protein
MHTIHAFTIAYTSLEGHLLSTNTSWQRLPLYAPGAARRSMQKSGASEICLIDESALGSQHWEVSIDGFGRLGRKENGWVKDS